MNLVQDILTYWYGQWPYDSQIASTKASIWFTSTPEIDKDIEVRFKTEIDRLLKQDAQADTFKLDLPNQLDQALAIIILLDQFTRNVYRGSHKAFAGDPKALAVCLSILDANLLASMPLNVAAFACMPLQHSEDPKIQELAIETFDQLYEIHGETAKGYADFARVHKNIIDEFGRYPHRNDAIGRPSTDAEQSYLNSDGHRFGQ